MKTKLKQLTAVLVTVFFAAVSLAVPAAAASKIAAPKNLKVTTKTVTTVSLSWDKVESAAKYIVYFSADPKKEYKEACTTSKTSAMVKSLKGGTKYWFYVRAVDKEGAKSKYSNRTEAFTEKASETKSTTLRVTKEAGTVKNNQYATVEAVGKPDTVYQLKVYYTTQKSNAKGTGSCRALKDGSLKWEWKVGAKTKPGTHKIVIEGGGEKIETSFVTEK
jgi:fibronectin type 3 domain-containing protein